MGNGAFMIAHIYRTAGQRRQRVARTDWLTMLFLCSHHRSQRFPLRPRSLFNDENGGRGEIIYMWRAGNNSIDGNI